MTTEMLCEPIATRDAAEDEAINKLMGLAIFGEKVAARLYLMMAEIKPEYGELLKKFAAMEAKHGTWFAEVSKENGIVPDKAFADNELGYLLSQARDHHKRESFESLAVLQGFIVESLAIATYQGFLSIAPKYQGLAPVLEKVLEEEHYHVDWIMRYLRLAFFDREDDFAALAAEVNIQGIDCIGGTMMNIARYLDVSGLSGADSTAAMMDGYSELLEDVGFDKKRAMKHVVSMFIPLIEKYRRGEKTK